MKILLVLALLVSPSITQAASTTLNWTDNSGANNDQEEGFSIERQINGGTWGAINTVKTGVTTYTDTTLTAPPAVTAPTPPATNTYCYQVKAFNHGAAVPPATTGPMQVSGPSNVACVDVLGIQNPAPIGVPAPASNLTATAVTGTAAATKKPTPQATKKK